jgi:hypothetical protein
MSKTTKVVTAGELRLTTLPRKTETYTVISHGFIIDNVKAMLSAKGFEVVVEEYRANNNLEVARGSYIIKRSEDPTFLMSFNWVNSYDKSTKFQCAIGGYVWENNSYVIDKEDNTFIRKHTGDADTLAKETIEEKINNAESYYLKVLNAKQKMQSITVNRQQVAKMLGELYFSYDMISIEQLSGIKKEYNKPSYVYSTNSDSLWTVYCHMLTVIKSSHPKQWLHQQGFIHNYLKMNYLMTADTVSFTTPPVIIERALLNVPDEDIRYAADEFVAGQLSGIKVPEVEVDPAQINLLDQIADLEADQMDEDLRYAAAELADNQVVQEEVEIDTVLHQSEEIILDTNKAEEELSDEFVAVAEPEDYVTIEEYTTAIDQVVTYLDPAGNTFEAPVVEEAAPRLSLDDILIRIPNEEKSTAIEDIFTEEEIEEVEEARALYENDEESLTVSDPKVISILQNEVNNIFGYDVEIEVFEDGENYNIVTNDGQEVVVPVDYVNNLI